MGKPIRETVHLGDESIYTYMAAERLLREQKNVTFVGKGPSMEPIIPHDTRMLWSPYDNEPISVGMPLFCRFNRLHYSCHMAWIVSDDHVLIGTTSGGLEGWVKRDQILGLYRGPWLKEE